MRVMQCFYRTGTVAAMLCAAAQVRAQSAPDYDFDWATIGHPGNPAYDGPDPISLLDGGRGSVPYVYRIARTEVTTSQWMEFVNTFTTQSDPFPGLAFLPVFWGAENDPEYSGPGYRFRLRSDQPQAGSLPVFGIDWRESAKYCNWLHNSKSTDLSSLESGAYDASTFRDNPDGTFSDQLTRNPDARFFIPTLDEWLKAAHYDPNRYGSGKEGYWLYSNRSESFPLPGYPGDGETSAGLDRADGSVYEIPLGAYPQTVSPWGLLDVTGGAEEWTEEAREGRWRIADGHYAGSSHPPSYPYPYLDQIGYAEWLFPTGSNQSGLRIASPIPSSSGCAIAGLAVTMSVGRRGRSSS